jgi:transposase
LKEQNYTYLEKADELFGKIHAPGPQADLVIVQTGKLRLKVLLGQFLAVQQHQKSYEQQIRAVLRKVPESKPIRTLPGLGKRLVPERVATLGPRSHRRFDSDEALSNLAGCSPITQASGKWKTVRMQTACVKPLRRTFRHWSFASLTHSKWAWAYYRYRRSRNHVHETILRCLAQKWSKILFAVWAAGQAYDERLHIEKLKRHRIAWAVSL